MSTALKIPVRMTRAEFLAWNASANQLWPFVDGEPRAMAPGVIPRVQAEINSRVPDLAVTCSSACRGLSNSPSRSSMEL